MKKLLVSTAICSSVAFAAMPGVAAAQEDAAAGAGIGEIIVTAQKRAENIQDVPIAISAVSGQFLESRGITSIDSLGSIAPNVKIERAPSNKTISQISIRGSVTINPAITWEPAVGLYLDGVYIAKAQGSIFDVADLERVEILRGPQGTLYGRNALAGAVNLVTKKPSGELGGSAEISYGNFDAWKAKAVLDLPAMGPLSVKLSGQIQKRDGFIKLTDDPFWGPGSFSSTPLEGRTNDLDSKSGMVQVRFEPSDTVTIDYAFDYSKFDQRPDYAQLVNGGYPLAPYINKNRQSKASLDGSPLYERSRSYGHALTAAVEVGEVTLKSITSYRNLKWNDRLDLDGSPYDIAYTGRDTKFHSFSQELQATGTVWDDRVNFVVGAFYYKEKAETEGPQRFFGAFGTPVLYQSDYGSHTRAWALYAQTDIKITDPLKLTLGARYTEEKKDISRYYAGTLVSPTIDLDYGDVPDAKYSNFSPAATLSYEFNRNVNAYARFARGFKSGGFNGETSDFRTATADCPSGAFELCDPYRPEKVDSYEIGLKTRLAGGKVIFNVAAFWDEHKDIQLSVFTANGAASSIVRNAAKARIRGLEVETVIRPVDALTINASFAYLDAKYKSYIEAIGGVDTDVSGNRAFPHTPKYTASIGADWRVAEGDWGKFNINGDLSYVSSYFTYPYALEPQRDPITKALLEPDAYATRSKGRTIVNLRANVADIPLSSGVKGEVSLWVRNLTKEDNPTNFIDFGVAFQSLTVGYFPDPRTYGITAGIKF
ncbi:putative TonB-dependent receptor [Caenibius tardaugens NBRC 16725]|uniref:Putative TonB-dependent receptor n=1 Tax=Caenibius tardaugens NBRC 16725 TaxID=1219035 RepID=U2YM66_9SPHN|nr:TonB-dependent receptor [Caenibius tardaugens]AZI36869.1 TonB-dependent receptor [Caenibius tardaugens NBRC 16725]GAD49552.1 putative TonB-dependent receptor [Caenibius tardaugens NBRC 16725]